VSARGKEIVSPDGKPIILKGINLGNWLEPEGYMFKFKEASSPRLISELIDELVGPDKAREFWATYRLNYITKKDIEFIKKVGFNSVRIPFDYRLFVQNEDPVRWDSTGFALLDSVVNWCSGSRLFVVLDMHCAPGGQTGDNIDDSYGYPFLFESEKSQQLAALLWQKIAERYRDDTTIIGYDLLNEPIAPYFDTQKLNPLLEPLYKRLTAAIREADRNHIIIVGGAQWDTNFRVFGMPFDSNLVYTFHKYWSDTTQSVIQEYLDFREMHNVPLWLGESGENTGQWIGSFRRMLERDSIGWCFWPYKKLSSKTCVVSIKTTEGYDEIIRFANSDRTSFDEIRKNMPEMSGATKALGDFLDDCKLQNCDVNAEYIKALGFEFP
jgi:aryl-phospho-beta-D-glucosidase BglC (GH1 family)